MECVAKKRNMKDSNVESVGIKMDPFTFGLVGISAAGGTLFLIGLLEQAGLKINETAIKLLLEATKYGGILYLLKAMMVLL